MVGAESEGRTRSVFRGQANVGAMSQNRTERQSQGSGQETSRGQNLESELNSKTELELWSGDKLMVRIRRVEIRGRWGLGLGAGAGTDWRKEQARIGMKCTEQPLCCCCYKA